MKFRKRPIIIEAIQIQDNEKSLDDLIKFMTRDGGNFNNITQKKFPEYHDLLTYAGVLIKTAEGIKIANIGDWVVIDDGDLYVHNSKIFDREYELFDKKMDTKIDYCIE